MTTLFATTPVGRAINSLSRGRLLQTPDQRAGWQIAASIASKLGRIRVGDAAKAPLEEEASSAEKEHINDVETACQPAADERFLQSTSSRILPEGKSLSRFESMSRSLTLPTAKRAADVIIVDWYGPDDEENPKNWALSRKVVVTLAICFLTFSVYGGSSMITPSIPGLVEEFGVSQTKGVLTLSVFILGYAVGPLFLGPPSDIPSIGRSTPYWLSMLSLVLFNIGAAKAQSYGTVIAMRLLAGMAGSPALATGGATLGDVWTDLALPKAISVWAIGAVCGPVLAPVIAGWAAMNVDWRLPYWLFVALSGIGLIITLVMLPETLPANILYRRANRLRALTHDNRLRSQGELDQAAIKPIAYVIDAFYMPIRLSFEPIVLYSSVLLGLVYAIFYAAFEAVPLIFGEIHGFNLGEQQLPFLGLGVNAFCLTLPFYILYLVYYFDPRFIANLQRGIIRPEDRLILAMLTSPIALISLLWTGWTSRADISFWSPLVALSFYLTPVFLLFQSILVYLSSSYVEHQAAVLAANDLIRSLIAAAFPIFATSMFHNLGLGKAYTTLAGISLALMLPLFGLYHYGAKLRAWSKFAHEYDKDIPVSSP